MSISTMPNMHVMPGTTIPLACYGTEGLRDGKPFLPFLVREERLGIYIGWFGWDLGKLTDNAIEALNLAGFELVEHQAGGVECKQPYFFLKQIEPNWRFLEVSRHICRHYFNKPWGNQDSSEIEKLLGGVGIEVPKGYYAELYESVYPIPLNSHNNSIVTGGTLDFESLCNPVLRACNSKRDPSIFIITDNSD